MVQKAIAIAEEIEMKAIRLDVLDGNIPAEHLYQGIGFQYLTTMQMYYEDAVQDTFIQLIKSGPAFDSEEHEKAWLIRTASGVYVLKLPTAMRTGALVSQCSFVQAFEVGLAERR